MGANQRTGHALGRRTQGLVAASNQLNVLGKLLVLLSFRRLARTDASGNHATSARLAYDEYDRATAEWKGASAAVSSRCTERCIDVVERLNSHLNEAVKRGAPSKRYELATEVQLVDELASRLGSRRADPSAQDSTAA